MNPPDPILRNVLQKAVAEQWLPADALAPSTEERPWPVVVLTAFGAWLAAIPLLVFLGLVLRNLLDSETGLYTTAALLLAVGTWILRRRRSSTFVEQLAVPLLAAGLALLGIGLFRHDTGPVPQSLLALATLALAIALPRGWLRALLGAFAAGLIATLALRGKFPPGNWITCHATLAVWLVALYSQSRWPPRAAAALESIAAGWLMAVLVALALLSGMTFLMGGMLGTGGLGDLLLPKATSDGLSAAAWLQRGGSMLLALAGALYAARRWPGLRRPLCGCVAAVLVGLCAWLPMLGGTLLALAVTGTTRRWQQAAFAALAAVWIVGSFYYQLQWSLAWKGAVLIVVAAALAVLAWRSGVGLRGAATGRPPLRSAGLERRASVLLGAGALLILLVANVGIWQKENLIAHGQPVFIALAPVDPRSLMQGDYMRLNFVDFQRIDFGSRDISRMNQAYLVMRREGSGVAVPLQVHQKGKPLKADEFLIELTPSAGRWMLVTDAWYFTEGEADRWATARYGDFRVLPNGQALLVGLADTERQPLER